MRRRSKRASCRSAAPTGRRGDERLIREFILQLKRGSRAARRISTTSTASIRCARFQAELASLQSEGFLAELTGSSIALTRDGLLRVDSLLHRFFLPQHTGIRYT